MKFKTWLKRFIAGMGIGVGAAIPGVSGAAVAIIFKIYEDIIGAVNGFTKHFKKSISVLFPVLIGIICAVIPCIILFDKALECFVFGLICIFAGLLIGSFPGVLENVKGVKPNKKQILLIIIGLIFVIALGIASALLSNAFDLNGIFSEMPWWLYLVLIPVGFVAAVALTVPGLSGSLILLIIGFYKPIINFTVEWAKAILLNGDWSCFGKLFGMLATFAIGVLLGVIFVSKIMNRLLEKYHDDTFFTIIGFIFGSILVLFFNGVIYNYYLSWAGNIVEGINPALPIYVEIPLGIGLLIVLAICSYQLVKISRKAGKN